jgi:acetolactate synthase-1/2/3 large subunit
MKWVSIRRTCASSAPACTSATPSRAVSAGDCYIFANPTACHQIAEAQELPLLTIVFNNGAWNTVRRSTLDIFPDGQAARAQPMPVVSLEPSPDYCLTARASRAWTERVNHSSELPAAIERAVAVIRSERRQALIDVQVPPL